MREVVATAERNMGQEFMEKNTGHFWGVVSTRPYMRAKLHLAEMLAQTGEAQESRAVYERMLTLNPRDNQGVRYTLMGLYLESKEGEAAAGLLSRYEEETVTCSFAWARVMERWLAGNMEEAEAALVRARKVNGFLERYLSGAAAMPREAPEYFSFGSDSEAQASAHGLSRMAASARIRRRPALRRGPAPRVSGPRTRCGLRSGRCAAAGSPC